MRAKRVARTFLGRDAVLLWKRVGAAFGVSAGYFEWADLGA
jgi:hypothetical protein